VIWMAIIPTLLYYFTLFVMVELDAGKFGISQVTVERRQSLWAMTKTHGFHFTSLISIIVFMLYGYTPVLSVFYATLLAVAVSFIRRDTALFPKRLIAALEAGSLGVLGVAATCATAGIIVGVVTLTGLGFKFSEIVIAYAGGSLLLTAIFTSLVVWIVGLAVPVTASYIICAVIAAPALIKLGVPDFAAHMFIFYYAVLSEVSPPTALSPFAAAAITGGDPYATTLQSWKYTLPAFLVPFVFVMDPLGIGLLMNIPKGGDIGSIIYITITTAIGIFALGAAAQGWLIARTRLHERLLLLLGGLLMVFSTLMEAIYELLTPWHLHYTDVLGIIAIVAVVGLQLLRRRASMATG
jgi:TRAP transporter 4TM/12TM fusion protein